MHQRSPHALVTVLGSCLFFPAVIVAQDKPVVTSEDYGRWESLGTGRLSPDGQWLAVPITRVNEENELRIHHTGSDSVVVVAYGGRATFSDDGRWAAYPIGKSTDERERLEESDEPVHDDLGLLDLATGRAVTVAGIESFAFGEGGRYLAMRRYAAEDAPDGTAEIVVRDLTADTDVNFGSVASFAWQDEGRLLAFTVHARDDLGNAVRLYDPSNGTLRTLDARQTKYARLTWREESSDLAVLRAFTDESRKDSSHVLLVWRNLQNGGARAELDPTTSDHIPNHRRIVRHRALTWADDGTAVFFGVKDWAAADAADSTPPDGEDQAEVEVWHARDRRVIPEQKRDAAQDENRSDLAAWHLEADRVVTLTDTTLERVQIGGGGTVVTALHTEPYAWDRMFGRSYQDLYAIDVDTGERTLAAQRVPFGQGASPSGRYLLYLKDDGYHAMDLARGETVSLSADVPAELVNMRYDHPVDDKPPFGVAGWTRDERSVLVYDEFDVWELPVDGQEARRLTAGRERDIRYRYLDLDPDDDEIDTSGDVYLSMTGVWTKHYGFSRLRDRRVSELTYRDDNVGRLTKADAADVYAYVVQDFDDSPDYFVSDAGFDAPRQVTRTNPFHEDFAWGHTELVEYTNPAGRRLHGALFYPADYDPSRRYPMIVYIYEFRSQSAKQYAVPSARNYYNPAVWTAQGYFVFQPDIVFETRNPGISSARTLEAAVGAVAAKGMIDPDRVGLVGHSWGGYQTAFVVTNTDIFAAGVAGAPLTNLVSMYGSIFWTANVPESGHFETGQERMEVPYWKDTDAYLRNSAVFNVESLDTPLLVEVGDADRNVDWGQGIEYYNAARRAGKDLVMLVYHNEGHGLRTKANQIDYHNRILEFFGHHLKGEDAAPWITDGVPYLEQRGERKN